MAVQPWRRWRLSRQISGSWEEIFQSCVYISYPPVRQRPGRSPLFGSPVQLTDCRRDCTIQAAPPSFPGRARTQTKKSMNSRYPPSPTLLPLRTSCSSPRPRVPYRPAHRNVTCRVYCQKLCFFFFSKLGEDGGTERQTTQHRPVEVPSIPWKLCRQTGSNQQEDRGPAFSPMLFCRLSIRYRRKQPRGTLHGGGISADGTKSCC